MSEEERKKRMARVKRLRRKYIEKEFGVKLCKRKKRK